jgi:protein-S-isoprenylcysteine O-methyltransferase Ste14
MSFVQQGAHDDDLGVGAPSHRIADGVAPARLVRRLNVRWGRRSTATTEPPSGTPGTTDHRRRRRLGHLEQWIWYLVAAVTYIGLGVFHKFLFNWFVGPIWLIAVVVLGPALWDWLRRRARASQ